MVLAGMLIWVHSILMPEGGERKPKFLGITGLAAQTANPIWRRPEDSEQEKAGPVGPQSGTFCLSMRRSRAATGS